jgi:hypothetical protein
MFKPQLECLGERITPNYAALYEVAEADGGGLIEVEYTEDGVAMDPVYLTPLGQPILRFEDGVKLLPGGATGPLPLDVPTTVIYTARAGVDNGHGGTGSTAITIAGTLAFVVNLSNMP